MTPSNAFIVPVVYFFYPETAYRSLEEMDTIFHNTTSVFNVVRVAKEEPHRYGKNGEVLINYQETEEHQRRRSSVARTASMASQGVLGDRDPEKSGYHHDHTQHFRGGQAGPGPVGSAM